MQVVTEPSDTEATGQHSLDRTEAGKVIIIGNSQKHVASARAVRPHTESQLLTGGNIPRGQIWLDLTAGGNQQG